MEKRLDDELYTILKRYDTYMDTTKPVLDFYSEKYIKTKSKDYGYSDKSFTPLSNVTKNVKTYETTRKPRQTSEFDTREHVNLILVKCAVFHDKSSPYPS